MTDVTVYGIDDNPIVAVTQWDSDLSIKIVSQEIDDWQTKFSPQSYNIYFFNEYSSIALLMTTSYSDDGLTVVIPNELLTEPYPITGFVQTDGEDGNITICRFRLNMMKKPKPSDYVYIDSPDYISLEAALADETVLSNIASHMLVMSNSEIDEAIG